MHQDLWTLEELIRKKQETVNRLDDELFQEIERQRVIEELMDGMSLTSSRQQYRNHSPSLNQSSCSEQSCDTEYLQNEIDKVKVYMQVVRQTGELPQIPEHLPLTQSFHHKKKKHPSRIRENLMATRLKLKTDVRPSETARKLSQDLRQLDEQSLKAEFQENQKTIANMNLKIQYQEKVMALRTAWREESLEHERSLIRQQLIKEEGEHARPTPTFLTSFPVKLYSPVIQPETESLQHDPLIRAQRTSRINSLVRCFGRANNKAAVLGQKIDKLLLSR